MTEDDKDHAAPVEEKVGEAERDLADLEQRSEKLGEDIGATRDDWEGKKADPSVPGAGGNPQRAEEGGKHPETAYPAKGPDDEATTSDPADNDRGIDDTPQDEREG
jgi:hypothetical protein